MSEASATRAYVLVGELVLSDGTRYTHFATYEAMNIEAALRQAVRVVLRWRGERIEGHRETPRCETSLKCRWEKTTRHKRAA